MAKIKDTCKRDISFEEVAIEDGKLVDALGDIVEQIKAKLPEGVIYFDLKATMAIPSSVENEE